MKARVTVTLKNGVLDPQGKAIEGALKSLGVSGVASVRQGKVFDIEIDGSDKQSAESALKAGDRPDARIDFLARRLLARPLRPEESAVVQESLAELAAHYQAHADEAKKLIAVGESKADPALDPATLAAWTMLANELMNLDEVLNK